MAGVFERFADGIPVFFWKGLVMSMDDYRYGQGYFGQQPGYSQYGWTPPSPQAAQRRAIRKTATWMGLMLILFFIASRVSAYFIYFLAMMLFPDAYNGYSFALSEVQTELLSILQYVGIMLVPIVFGLIALRIPFRAAFPRRKAPAELTVLAIPVMLALTVFSSLIISVLSAFFSAFGVVPYFPDMQAPQTLPAQLLYVLYLAVFPAFLEEFLFRGVIMQSLRRFSDSFALVVSSVLFGLVHGNLIQAPNAFLLGLCIGYFVLRTNNLFTGIVLHFVNNLISLLLQYAVQDLSEYSQNLLVVILYASYLLLGFLAVVILSRRYTDMFSLKQKHTELPFPRQMRAFFSSPAILISFIFILQVTVQYFREIP